MTSKEIILQNIRKNNLVKDLGLPSYSNFGIKFDDPYSKFNQMIESVGGKTLFIKKEEIEDTIFNLFSKEKEIASNSLYFKKGNFFPNEQEDAHLLKNIDVAVIDGNFAVAENAAVWVSNKNNRHRTLYFIAQNIVILVDKKNIVHNMHEAYEKISFENISYGTFISGPSKTADIEQSLVIGAHGPKSGYVIFIE
jgi:L-lactate dehydrogenase complex protein LldG